MAALSDYFQQPPYMFRNKIMNGEMLVAQRTVVVGTEGVNSVQGTSNAWRNTRIVPDRWVTSLSGVSLSANVAQTTVVPDNMDFDFSYRYTSNTAVTSTNDIAFLEQKIEGFNVIDLAYGTSVAKSVTISFWVRASTAGTYSGAWRARSSTTGIWSNVFLYTVSAVNTWEYKTITIPGNTQIINHISDHREGCSLVFDLGTLNFNRAMGPNPIPGPGTWVGPNSDFYGTTTSTKLTQAVNRDIYITGVQVEAGRTASQYEFQPFDYVLKQCQRYYYEPIAQYTTNASGSAIFFNCPFPTPMRTNSPTVSASSLAALRPQFTNRYSASINVGTTTVTLSAIDAEFVPWVVEN